MAGFLCPKYHLLTLSLCEWMNIQHAYSKIPNIIQNNKIANPVSLLSITVERVCEQLLFVVLRFP